MKNKNKNLNIPFSISFLLCFFLSIKILAESNNYFDNSNSSPELQIQENNNFSGNDEKINSDSSIKQIKHTFWIKVLENKSNLNYSVSQRELLSGTINGIEPNIQITGSLVLKSRNSISKCFVKLPNDTLEAVNEFGDKILLQLKGNIGNQNLSNFLIQPEFDEYNEVSFTLQGFILPESLFPSLRPGNYAYKDALKLIIEFNE